ncbi:type I methionyl aminopeptidase [Nocardiopsis ansamitocini]|uniref:Methionine aminopeptidase n=1 Tax=Nocardiopsis ansamitocini TaxID=1670832 RepID=A0A9W6PB90_9ACTN|nr:type I methionyl aminopeptidase [Nocardiopsis ansamitocini]GLU50486.1 methionine aminopeptidase [Nocardiopsis ansamitocini]
MVELRTPGEIEAMRAAGRVVARALRAARDRAAVGVTLRELDEAAAQVITEEGAKPLFLDYHPAWAPTPFPGVICASVNDAVVHGIPTDDRLADGDLVSIDCGALLDGWSGDAAISFTVGTADPADTALVEAADGALWAGIAEARPGGRLGDISHAIGRAARKAGYALLADHGGHGIGRTMHEEPFVANDGKKGKGMRLRTGLVLALEPMLIAGGKGAYRHDPDGWTVRSAGGGRAAHVEHTVAVTEDGPLVLTEP